MFVCLSVYTYVPQIVPILWETWAGRNPSSLRINYFSDIEDSSYNTISIGVNNTDRGE